MTTLNAAASEAALAAGVVAATDVTGFSLLGHLHRMLRASGARAVVSASAVPLLPGALALTEAGYVSGGTRNNMSYLEPFVSIDPVVPEPVAVLLQDAQTSGGLLLATSVAGSVAGRAGAARRARRGRRPRRGGGGLAWAHRGPRVTPAYRGREARP